MRGFSEKIRTTCYLLRSPSVSGVAASTSNYLRHRASLQMNLALSGISGWCSGAAHASPPAKKQHVPALHVQALLPSEATWQKPWLHAWPVPRCHEVISV